MSELLQHCHNNEWVSFNYIYDKDLEEKDKERGLEPIQCVHNYCEDVLKSHQIEYV